MKISKLRIAFWVLLVLAGAAQAWYTRHHIYSDGVSYLNIALNYAHGNWHDALNAYWSPLYSWIIAMVLLLLHPSNYWYIASLHLVNYIAYLASLVGYELWLSELIRFQQKKFGAAGLSKLTMRIIGYTTFLLASLILIDIRVCTPDMIAMAIVFFLSYLLFKVASGQARATTYFWFGVLLALGYLSRAAFVPIAGLYVCVTGVLLWTRNSNLIRPLAWICIPALLICLPFVVALSKAKGYFTLGAAGKANYAWEINGAARSTHWQGEPYNIGTPKHPTHKVLDHPATYTFAAPVPGWYPPWYDPSYWYEGVAPHFELKPQLRVLYSSLRDLTYLFLRSPVTIPCFLLIILMGWRRWISADGIFAYWFVLLPVLAYIAIYTLVYMDSRYIAGSLAIVWMCLAASIALPGTSVRQTASLAMQVVTLLFCVGYCLLRLKDPVRVAAKDLLHGRESEWSLQWMLAERFKELGLKPGDRVAYMGSSINSEWAVLDDVRIVAEIPVVFKRYNSLMSRVYSDTADIDYFWSANPEQQAQVLAAFRSAGAVMAIADEIPKNAHAAGWQQALPPDPPHLPSSSIQMPALWPKTAFIWLSEPPRKQQ